MPKFDFWNFNVVFGKTDSGQFHLFEEFSFLNVFSYFVIVKKYVKSYGNLYKFGKKLY